MSLSQESSGLDRLVIALAQLNPTVGDIAGNIGKLLAARAAAQAQGADLLVSTELFVTGYPPEDLVRKPALLDAVEAAAVELAAATAAPGPALLVGLPWRQEGSVGNAVMLFDRGERRALRFKHELPNYGVFDEVRVFAPGPPPAPIAFRGARLGVMICEDMWFPEVAASLKAGGAQLLIVLNGSPFEREKADQRLNFAVARIKETGLALLYVNQICGQDELVFDGASFALDAECKLRLQAPAWEETVLASSWRLTEDQLWVPEPGPIVPPLDPIASVYAALLLGLRDYVTKNRFPGIVLGLSGGIDSALCAALAVDALGADKVHCVMMPSRYTSDDSLEDAAEVARLLGADLRTIDIEPGVAAFSSMLAPSFAGRGPDTTEENLQSRVRGVTVMALSNKFGWMVLSTGNKSEMSAGYATLYGDMCGGFAVLKDLYKTTVFELSRWRNANRPKGALGPKGPVMPERVITKPPTAELRENQKDQDSLPPYENLDDILHGLIEEEKTPQEIAGRGHDPALVLHIWKMLDRAEYKRRQAPPGVKTTARAFGRDRRYPITNAFQGDLKGLGKKP